MEAREPLIELTRNYNLTDKNCCVHFCDTIPALKYSDNISIKLDIHRYNLRSVDVQEEAKFSNFLKRLTLQMQTFSFLWRVFPNTNGNNMKTPDAILELVIQPHQGLKREKRSL